MRQTRWIVTGLLVGLMGLGLFSLAGCGKSEEAGHDHGAAPAQTATKAAEKYRCEKCGMEYSADDAKKNDYKCTMDGGKLVPEKS
jgi:DNA-directed RNA polymerase subunit RPC12/RpoP